MIDTAGRSPNHQPGLKAAGRSSQRLDYTTVQPLPFVRAGSSGGCAGVDTRLALDTDGFPQADLYFRGKLAQHLSDDPGCIDAFRCGQILA